MIRKTILSAFVAWGVFACGDSPTVSQFMIEQVFTSDSYDSDGNIFMRDTRIRENQFFSLDLYLGPAVSGQVGMSRSLASSVTPACNISPELSSVCITLSDGFLLISDKEKALLEYAEDFAESSGLDLKPYLLLHMDDGITHLFHSF